jgi:hypothetical protein
MAKKARVDSSVERAAERHIESKPQKSGGRVYLFQCTTVQPLDLRVGDRIVERVSTDGRVTDFTKVNQLGKTAEETRCSKRGVHINDSLCYDYMVPVRVMP